MRSRLFLDSGYVINAITFKYRAFLSYSHRDKVWGKWLHGALEGYSIDKDLVGRETPMGPVPKTLGPIFRDREDFSAGHSLTEQTIAALKASQFLIVICSPNSAHSPYVNEEIWRFKALGRADRVIPVIVDGEPGDEARECFPTALRFKLGPDGKIGDEREEPIAADARPHGDGKQVALSKVVSGVLGLGLDEVVRRAQHAQKRHARIRNGVIALLLAATTVSVAGFAWARYELARNEALLDRTLQRATSLMSKAVAMSDQFGVPRRVSLGILEETEGLFRDVAELGRATAQLRYRRAWMLIEFAHNYAVLGDTTRQRARAEDALSLMQGLSAEDPANPEWQHTLSVVYVEIGDVLRTQGRLAAAFSSYSSSLAIDQRFAASDPNNIAWQAHLSLLYERIADTLMSQGKFIDAIQYYRAQLAINERQVASQPGHTGWLDGLAVAYERIGTVLVALGKLDEALVVYRADLAISERLATSNPMNARWQRSVSISQGKIGEVLVLQKRLGEALIHYRASLEIDRRLVASDSGNTGWQRDLAIRLGSIGDVLIAQGKHAEARDIYRSRLLVVERLTKSDPQNAQWQIDLAASHGMIADSYVADGDLDNALSSYRESHAIWERVSVSDPGNVQWQLDLLFSHSRLALFGDQPLKRFEFIVASLRAFKSDGRLTPQQELWLPYAEQGLAATDPKNSQRQWDLLNMYWRTAALSANPTRQMALVVAMLRKLNDESKLTVEQARWLPVAEAKLATLQSQ